MMKKRFVSSGSIEDLLFCAVVIASGLLPSGARAAQNLLKQFPVKGAAPSKAGGPAQSQLARAGAFPSISKAQLSGALDARNLALMNKNVGKTVLCVGTIDKLYTPKKGAMVLLNMAPNYKTALVGSVKGRDFGQFPNLQTLKARGVARENRVISRQTRN